MKIYIVQIQIKNFENWVMQKYEYSFLNRLKLIKKIIKDNTADIQNKSKLLLLFPAGMFKVRENNLKICIKRMEYNISKFLRINNLNICVVLGIDTLSPYTTSLVKGGECKEQIAVAITKKGIISATRKFYPTYEEKGGVKLAKTFDSSLFGHKRYFKYNSFNFCLAVCYDIFGIRKKDIKIRKNTMVLNLIHLFTLSGQGSGVSYFVRDGCIKASEYISNKVFWAAVFENRNFANFVSGANVEKNLPSTKISFSDSNLAFDSVEETYFNTLVRIDKNILPKYESEKVMKKIAILQS